MGDKGVAATNKTLELWESLAPATITGANRSTDEQSQDIGYVTVKGIKIAMVSFADFNNNGATPAYSINLYHDEALVRKLVGEARKNADIVMASMHWGTEDSAIVNQDQRAQTTLLASLGVDVIIGTGPHVLQPVEVIERPDGGQMTVWYSLGNMLSSQLQLKGLIGGIASFEITKDAQGAAQVGALTFIPTYMHYEWTAAEAAASDLSARKNAKVYLLSEATTPLSNSLFNTTVEAQQKYVDDTLGSLVKVQR
jgi:poly-gamma-glutamate capsule biosynthesis protein CapA/YwtB (metallophosphatase superfamily)